MKANEEELGTDSVGIAPVDSSHNLTESSLGSNQRKFSRRHTKRVVFLRSLLNAPFLIGTEEVLKSRRELRKGD